MRRRRQKLQRGDLIFWKGHVAIVRDAETIVHANAHHMATVIERHARGDRADHGGGKRSDRDQAAVATSPRHRPAKAGDPGAESSIYAPRGRGELDPSPPSRGRRLLVVAPAYGSGTASMRNAAANSARV